MTARPVMMHEYACPECGLHWKQQVRCDPEMCPRCQEFTRPVDAKEKSK